MNWIKLLYVLVIALLYVPMVFLGANVFFPKYTGSESYFHPTKECYPRYAPSEKLSPAEQQQIAEEQQVKIEQCLAEQRQAELAWEKERGEYDGIKYMAITAFNLVILIIVLFTTFKDAVIMGLFIGTVVATFGATIRYWDYARTRIGFTLLLVMFFAVLYFVNKRQEALLGWKKKK